MSVVKQISQLVLQQLFFVTGGLYETKDYPTKENGDELTEHVGKNDV